MRCVASESPISHLEAFVSADVEWGIHYPLTPPSFYAGGSDNGNSTTDSGTTTESNEDAAPHCDPADPKYGLPTAPLGVDFDVSLDDCFGYETVSDTDYVAYVDLMANATVLEDGPENVANISGDLEGDEYLMNKILLVHSRCLHVHQRDTSTEAVCRGKCGDSTWYPSESGLGIHCHWRSY